MDVEKGGKKRKKVEKNQTSSQDYVYWDMGEYTTEFVITEEMDEEIQGKNKKRSFEK